jgi:ATP-binding cassette subfamily A (ABC1) protein 3
LFPYVELLFSQLKGLSGAELNAEIKKYISLLELEPKENAASSTLSGGMKRKVAAGVALCGDSKVSCFINCDHLKL